MNKQHKNRDGFIQLYNPKKEGLGDYDIHYFNAYTKIKVIDYQLNEKRIKRQAA